MSDKTDNIQDNDAEEEVPHARRYQVTLTGVSPMLLHKNNLAWRERVKTWQMDSNNKSISEKGDDRSPAWTWLGYTYVSEGLICVESDNIMTMLREAGAKIQMEGKSTFKAVTQSGIIMDQFAWPILINGKTVPWADFSALKNELDFKKHEELAQAHGFELFAKPASVGRSKHIRVRARLDTWKISGTITVVEQVLSLDILQTIFSIGGRRCGLGDWRPSNKASGSFGMFTAQVKEL
jgi:hypothetical protein